MVTVALSVITSTSGWSSATVSPSFTSHLTISPSTTPSPMSGSLNSKVAIWTCSPVQQLGDESRGLTDALQDARRTRQVLVLQGVGERRVPPGDAPDGRLQVDEAPLLDQRGDLCSQ